jgi:hypothetical protein
MTVSRLIEELKRCDPGSQVVIVVRHYGEDTDWEEVETVNRVSRYRDNRLGRVVQLSNG